MTGTYEINMTTSTAGNYMGGDYTVCEYGSFSVDAVLNSLPLRFYSGTIDRNFVGKVVVYSSTGTLLASSAVQSFSVTSSSTYYDVPFQTPLSVTAGTLYKVGYWTGPDSTTAMPGILTSNASSAAIASTPAGITWTPNASTLLASAGDGNPTATWSYRNTMKMMLDIPPSAPTAITVTNAPVPQETVPTVSWTYNGPVAQTDYQMRWRKIS